MLLTKGFFRLTIEIPNECFMKAERRCGSALESLLSGALLHLSGHIYPFSLVFALSNRIFFKDRVAKEFGRVKESPVFFSRNS